MIGSLVHLPIMSTRTIVYFNICTNIALKIYQKGNKQNIRENIDSTERDYTLGKIISGMTICAYASIHVLNSQTINFAFTAQ
jgi:hypothetical protein